MRVSSLIEGAPMRRRGLLVLIVVATLVLPAAGPALAQGPPPRQGTSSVGSNTDSFYRAAGALVAATAAGLGHVFRFTKDLVTPGGPGPDAFVGLQKGTVVVVHYPEKPAAQSARPGDAASDEGPTSVEGRVQSIDRGRKEITVRFDSKTTETFQLVERAAAEVGAGASQPASDPDRVTIDHTDPSGQKIVHPFRKKS